MIYFIVVTVNQNRFGFKKNHQRKGGAAMKMSHQLFQEYLQVPKNWSSLPTHKLFEEVGLVTFLSAGFPTFLPIGQRLVNSVNNIIREETVRGGFEEIYLPIIQDNALLESTGRANQFNKEFFRIDNNKFILTPTNEEVYINLASHTHISYRHLPIRMFQIADKFRNVARPKGIFRSKEFLMCDMVSIDMDERMLRESVAAFEEIIGAVLHRLEVSAIRIEKYNGCYVDFVIECVEGNIGIAHNPDRYQNGGVPASSVGMYFLFNHHGPQFINAENKIVSSCLGSYGIGVQRCIHAVIEQHRDDLGIAFPKSVRPFDSSVIVLNALESQQKELAEKCYKILLASGAKPLFDERTNRTLKEKASLSDFFGIPFKLIIGRREASNGSITLKWRNGKEEQISPEPGVLLKILNN